MPQNIDALKKRLSQVTLDGRTYYVAEGDLLLDEQQLGRYADGGQANSPLPDDKPAQELLAILSGGKVVRWKHGLELTYYVAKGTFPTAEYDTVRANMRQATHDWEETCGVKFRHRSELDDAASPSGALFSVRRVDSGGEFIAAAFFPNDPAVRRHVVVDPSYFTTSFDKVGVLRHELGHVLGFRHEHIRPDAPAECFKESLQNTLDLSKYDPKSVMHYFCGSVGDRKLRISDVDLQASQRLYGPPLHKIQEFE